MSERIKQPDTNDRATMPGGIDLVREATRIIYSRSLLLNMPDPEDQAQRSETMQRLNPIQQTFM